MRVAVATDEVTRGSVAGGEMLQTYNSTHIIIIIYTYILCKFRSGWGAWPRIEDMHQLRNSGRSKGRR